MQEMNTRSVTTEPITSAFGWEQSENSQQQDVQELNRLLFDLIERALKDTPYDTLI